MDKDMKLTDMLKLLLVCTMEAMQQDMVTDIQQKDKNIAKRTKLSTRMEKAGENEAEGYAIDDQSPTIQVNLNQQRMNGLLNMMQSFCEKLIQQKQAANIDQSPPQEMSIQDMEDLKQQYLDEMRILSNQIQIKDYRNKKIDIRYKRECEIMIDEIKVPPSILIIPVLPTMDLEDSLIMGDEDLSTILENESNEFIKSSIEDLVSTPSESEDTSGSDSECDFLSCDDFSPIDVLEGNSVTFCNPLFDSNNDFTSSDDESLSDEDVPENKSKIYSNPLFKFNDEYISSDVNPLFYEVFENIKNKDSYVSNLDEPDLLVTPFSDTNKDECFDPGGDIDEIDAFLEFDVSTDIKDVYYDLEGEIIYLDNFLTYDTIHSLLFEMFLEHDPKGLKDEPNDDDLKIASDYEDSHACSFVHRLLKLQSLAYGKPIS
uniref:Reverse transcriptase domain-containing protein n=1 Tax=Tanacetum cinerariifolium TaxID=118510 RepID=A0A6L2LUS0_TANCI|nr:hypothetical protein [Tanacetum cinerariifolium]